MITEDYVSFETAKLLKEKGFRESTTYGYYIEDFYYPPHKQGEFITVKPNDFSFAYAPPLHMAMKWLREVHNIHIKVHCSGNRNYLVYAQSLVTAFHDFCIESTTCSFNTYEEACEAAIKYCLENLI